GPGGPGPARVHLGGVHDVGIDGPEPGKDAAVEGNRAASGQRATEEQGSAGRLGIGAGYGEATARSDKAHGSRVAERRGGRSKGAAVLERETARGRVGGETGQGVGIRLADDL